MGGWKWPCRVWSSNLASVTAMSQHLGDHFANHSPNKSLEQRGIFQACLTPRTLSQRPVDEDGAAHGLQGPPGDSSPWAEGLSGHCPLSRPTGRGHLENKGQTPKSYKPGKQILALQELHWSIEPPTPMRT